MSEAGFAESTIQATVWLIVHAPERLPRFLAARPPGKTLEAVARKWIAEAQAKRAEARAT